jgi:dTDP-4-amino-4,6-dideoxygalactose transaminase
MGIPFVDLKAQHQPIEGEMIAAISKVIAQTNFILGEEVKVFEQQFAQYCQRDYAIGVDNGLSGLKLAMRAFDIGEGDEVIIPANTFVATAAAITFVDAKPVLVDIKPGTYNIDPDKIEAAITPRTKAIMPVHLYGIPVDIDSILGIANKHGLVVIEDACQAHGAFYKGRRAGSFGHAAAFSFYPAKNLGCAGDGGAVVTNDADAAEKMRALRNCGSKEKYYHLYEPYNHRLDTIQAAVLSVKLPHLDAWNAARAQHAALYNELLADSEYVTPATPESTTPVWHLYVIRTEHRAELQAFLSARGIGTAIHYPIPVHMQPFYKDLGYQEGDFPVTEAYAPKILSLPMYAEMTDSMVREVVAALKEFALLKNAEAPEALAAV